MARIAAVTRIRLQDVNVVFGAESKYKKNLYPGIIYKGRAFRDPHLWFTRL